MCASCVCGGGEGEVKLIVWGNKGREEVCLRSGGKWRAGAACFLTKTFKCAVCSNESGWACRAKSLTDGF